MRRISKITTIFLLGTASAFASSVSTVNHSVNHSTIDISKGDTNRLLCSNGDFGKKVYSKDKEFTVEATGNNAFVKLSPVVTTSDGTVVDTKINDFSRDLYIECNNELYSLILVPKDITAQTIVLKDDYNKPKENNNKNVVEYEKSRDYEQTLLNLIEKGYKEIAPDGYEIDVINKSFRNYEEVTITHRKDYIGSKYKVSEFLLKLNQGMELTENMFIADLQNPLAIALTELVGRKGDEIRLIAVSNIEADKLTYHEKLTNFDKSYKELQEREAVKVESETKKVKINNDILNFIDGDK
jgi:hypothetical protein